MPAWGRINQATPSPAHRETTLAEGQRPLEDQSAPPDRNATHLDGKGDPLRAKNKATAMRHDQTEQVQVMLETSRFWLEINHLREERRLDQLDASELLQSLDKGETVIWKNWDIRPTPARRVLDGTTEQWLRGLWLNSDIAFTSYDRINRQTIEQACAYIKKVEKRREREDELERLGVT